MSEKQVGFMNRRTEIIGLLFSSLVSIVLWRILLVPMGLFIAAIIGIIFFLTYSYISSEERTVNYRLPSLRFRKIAFSCLLMASIIVVLFVHPISEVEFIAWNDIPIPSLLRLFLSLFLILFSPGYMVLNLMDKDEKLTVTEKILFSILINLFLLPFIGCLSFALGSNIRQSGTASIILLNISLFILYILFKTDKSEANKIISININEKLILVSLLIFIVILLLNKYSLNLTWDYGDLDIYFGYSVSFTKDVLPMSPVGPGVVYPYWPFVFLAQFFVLSGVPYANAFQFVSIPITFLPILSFYTMVSAFFREQRHRKVPIVATILGSFGGGLGWVFGAHLLSCKTVQCLYRLFNIMARTNSGYLVPSFYSAPGITGIYPLYTHALTSIFALVWLIYSERAADIGSLRYALISVVVALGYLAHIAEMVFFIFIFVVSILIFKHEDVSLYRKCAASIILGLLLVALSDIIVGGTYYTSGDPFTYYGFPLYQGTVVLSALALFLSFIRDHLKIPEVSLEMSRNKIKALKIACSCSIIYLYGLCLIIWGKVYETYNNLPIQMHMVPWYAWPNRLGICGLIALLGVIYLINKNKYIKKYSFFMFLVPVSFAIARIVHMYPDFYFEDRLTFFIAIPVTILASYTLLEFYKILKKLLKGSFKNIIFAFTLSAVLVLGFLPGLLVNEAVDFNYWSKGEKLTKSELDALNFLRLNTPPNCSVLTLTARSSRLLSHAGLFQVQTYVNRDPSIILSPLFPETTIYSLTKSQLKYIYLASADRKELEQNIYYTGFLKDYLLKYLPIAFQNKEVTIYEVPVFSIPTSSSIALVISGLKNDEACDGYHNPCSASNAEDIMTIKTDNQSKNHYSERFATEFLPLITFALSQNEYSVVLQDDPARFNYSTVILTRDLNLWDEAERQEFIKFMNWVNGGGRLIVLESSGGWPFYRPNISDYIGWYDENFTKWTSCGCSVTSNGSIVTVKMGNEGTGHGLCSPPVSIQVNSYPYVVIRWKTDGSSLYFCPHGTKSSYHCVELGASTGWTTSIINLNKFYDILLNNYTDLKADEQVDRMLFRSSIENATYHVDYIGFYKAYPLPPFLGFASALSLHSNGSLKADGIKSQMGHTNLTSIISVPLIYSTDDDVKVIANYTMKGQPVSPYALTKKIGNGEITYLVVSPVFSAIENSTDYVKRSLFGNMGSLINIVDLNLTKNIIKWTNYFPQFDFTIYPVNLTGKVYITTDYVKLQKLNVSYIRVNFSNGTIKIINLNYSVVDAIEYTYPVKFGIEASEVHLSKTGLGRYSGIEIAGDFNLTMEIPEDGSVKMLIRNGTALLNGEFQGSTIKLNIKNNNTVFILVKNPTIVVEGSAYFGRARIYRNHYKMPLFYDDGSEPFEVIGNVKLTIEHSDNGVSFVDNFALKGRWFYPSAGQKQPSFTEMDIPWPSVFASSLHAILLAIIFGALVFYIILQYKKVIRDRVEAGQESAPLYDR